MKIAIIKLSSLGDIVHSMVVLQFIKKHYPESVIDWVVEKRFKGILENNPHINQIHTVNLNKVKRVKSIKLLLTELVKIRRFGKYDVVIDLQGLIKSAIITKFISSRKTVGFDKNSIRERLASYFYNQKVVIGYDKNTIERYVKLISEALRIKIIKDDIINKELYLFSKSKLLISQTPYIVFIVGSTWPSRNYPKEKYVQVANAIKKDCLVIWGNEQEKEKAEWISSESNYVQVMPKLSLDDLKHVIGHASLLIGNDTGPSHMAWALNIPSIILFGPTPVERSFQTPINKVLQSSSKVDHFKLDKNDFSIKEIKTSNIIKIASDLLRENI
jgi:heptosyltransferase-1